ncbi:MAG: flagellar hook-associated protein FlgK [Roseomonas sp.]
MSIDAALLIARSGLLHTQRALSNAAENVANANTEGYTRKRIAGEAISANGQGSGVRTLGPMREVDTALVNEMNKRRSAKSAAEIREAVMERISQAHGNPANADGLGDLVAKLRTSFVELRADPSQVAKQQTIVLGAATNLTDRFNELGHVIGEARQGAHDSIVSEITQVNSTIREITTLTRNIMERKGAGIPTADIEDQRDLALARLSDSIGVTPIHQQNGGLILLGAGGLTIPLLELGDVFAIDGATIEDDSFYGTGGSIPPITLKGADITSQMMGGRIGEQLTLRDQTLPRYQAEVDIAAAEIADRFRAEGLRLFTDSDGSVPNPDLPYAGSTQIGFAARMQVNSAVQNDVRLVRDGTETIAGPPAFTPNPIGGPAAFTGLIDRVLNQSFGATASGGTSWGGFRTIGLGPDGSLSSPFGSPSTIQDYSSLITGTQTADSAEAIRSLETAKQFSEGLEARFTRQSRVDVDSEMASLIQLQSAYAANARVLSTAQSMWETLIGAVR